MPEKEKPMKPQEPGFSNLGDDEDVETFQKVIAPLMEDELANIVQEGKEIDASDISAITSMLEQRGVEITPQINALIVRKVEDLKEKQEQEEQLAKEAEKKEEEAKENDLVDTVTSLFTGLFGGEMSAAPPPAPKKTGITDMGFYNRMSKDRSPKD